MEEVRSSILLSSTKSALLPPRPCCRARVSLASLRSRVYVRVHEANGDAGVTRHVYDTNGQRVLRVDPDRSKTVYLGATELRWTPGSTDVDVARYYPGGTQRGFDGTLTYTIGDHQGSIMAIVDATSGAYTHVRHLPYGQLRAGNTSNDKGFLNQTHDPTANLIYLNNRHHDPTLGAFISVDPLVTKTEQAYIYGAANPVRHSDPSGLEVVTTIPSTQSTASATKPRTVKPNR